MVLHISPICSWSQTYLQLADFLYRVMEELHGSLSNFQRFVQQEQQSTLPGKEVTPEIQKAVLVILDQVPYVAVDWFPERQPGPLGAVLGVLHHPVHRVCNTHSQLAYTCTGLMELIACIYLKYILKFKYLHFQLKEIKLMFTGLHNFIIHVCICCSNYLATKNVLHTVFLNYQFKVYFQEMTYMCILMIFQEQKCSLIFRKVAIAKY